MAMATQHLLAIGLATAGIGVTLAIAAAPLGCGCTDDFGDIQHHIDQSSVAFHWEPAVGQEIGQSHAERRFHHKKSHLVIVHATYGADVERICGFLQQRDTGPQAPLGYTSRPPRVLLVRQALP